MDGCSASCSSPSSNPFSGAGRGVPRWLLASGLASRGSFAPATFSGKIPLWRHRDPETRWGSLLHVASRDPEDEIQAAATLPQGEPGDLPSSPSSGGLDGEGEEAQARRLLDSLPWDASTAAHKTVFILIENEFVLDMLAEQEGPADIKKRAVTIYLAAALGLIPSGRLWHHFLSEDLVKKCNEVINESVCPPPSTFRLLGNEIMAESVQYALYSQLLEVACSDLAAAFASSEGKYVSPPLALAGELWEVQVEKGLREYAGKAGFFLRRLAGDIGGGAWSQEYYFKLALIDRASPTRSIVRRSVNRFGVDQVEWGWSDFAALAEVTDPASTFVVDGKVCIEVYVKPTSDRSAATLFPAPQTQASDAAANEADFTAAETGLSLRMQRDYLDSIEISIWDAVGTQQLRLQDSVQRSHASVCAVLPFFAYAGADTPSDSASGLHVDPAGSTKPQGGGKGFPGRYVAKVSRATRGFGKPLAPTKSMPVSVAKGGASRADSESTPLALSNVTPLELGVIAGCLAAVKAARSAWKVS